MTKGDGAAAAGAAMAAPLFGAIFFNEVSRGPVTGRCMQG